MTIGVSVRGRGTTSVRLEGGRPGDNCDTADITGTTITAAPRLYTSAGVTYWWTAQGRIDNLFTGTQYLLRLPRAGAAQSGVTSAQLALSWDGKDMFDWSKTWSFGDATPATTVDYRQFTFIAQGPSVDFSTGLPSSWGMGDERIFNDWAGQILQSPGAPNPEYVVATTPSEVDQFGRTIPEQTQRLFRIGTGPLRVLMISDQHASEHVNTRMWAYAIDALLAGTWPQLLTECTFVCTHTINPGKWASHNRGYAVGAQGSGDPNRAWGQRNNFFNDNIEFALETDSGRSPPKFDFAIDYHGAYAISPELWYPVGSRGGEFHTYMDTYDNGLFGTRFTDLANSTQNAAIEQWDAQLGLTVEVADLAGGYDDTQLARFGEAVLGGLDLAITGGFFP